MKRTEIKVNGLYAHERTTSEPTSFQAVLVLSTEPHYYSRYTYSQGKGPTPGKSGSTSATNGIPTIKVGYWSGYAEEPVTVTSLTSEQIAQGLSTGEVTVGEQTYQVKIVGPRFLHGEYETVLAEAKERREERVSQAQAQQAREEASRQRQSEQVDTLRTLVPGLRPAEKTYDPLKEKYGLASKVSFTLDEVQAIIDALSSR